MRPLVEYTRKRNFRKTPEPQGEVENSKSNLKFVVQEHHASHLHYDFRLELGGVLKSWAIPKGPSMDPSIKRLAVEVEDHPLAYASFEGTIPKGQYGGGDVYIWDEGTWSPGVQDPGKALKDGKLEFSLAGKKLHGDWILLRTRRIQGRKAQWLLIKRSDGTEIRARSADTSKKSKARISKNKSKTKMKALADIGFVSPQLALLVGKPPMGKNWIHETKFDGYRTQAQIKDGKVALYTRTGQDWTDKYPNIAQDLLKCKSNAVIDGEIVWLNEKGISDFQKLQNLLSAKNLKNVFFYAFDLLSLDDIDLRQRPLVERKKILHKLLKHSKFQAVRFSQHFSSEEKSLFKQVCQRDLEGVVSKEINSPYTSGRDGSWVKSKCKNRQEFVIGGYTEGEGRRKNEIGALLLGVYEKGKLRFVGKVGTGFGSEDLKDIRKKLERVEQKASPFVEKSPRPGNTFGQIHWVRPDLVAEISFAQWTKDKMLRSPVFYSLREDKPARQIHIEMPEMPEIEISHPERIVFADEKITKAMIAEYYQKMSSFLMPHIERRPLTVLRCPEGVGKSCFIQRHFEDGLSDHIYPVTIEERNGSQEYMTIDSSQGLIELVQKGCLEFHCWNCHSENLDRPDQIVMDFDPGPGVLWRKVIDAALELKDILDRLNLKSFVKLSGGKGIHVHVPFEPFYNWDQAKTFANTLAREMVSRKPELYLSTMAKHKREKKIFIDYLRNAAGATAVVPYSVRARSKSSVALPLHWSELAKIKSPDFFSLKRALKWVAERKSDPWQDYFSARQTISILEKS